MTLITESTIKDAEVIITVACISLGGLVLICKVVACELLDAVFDVKERRLERKKKIEEKIKGVGG